MGFQSGALVAGKQLGFHGVGPFGGVEAKGVADSAVVQDVGGKRDGPGSRKGGFSGGKEGFDERRNAFDGELWRVDRGVKPDAVAVGAVDFDGFEDRAGALAGQFGGFVLGDFVAVLSAESGVWGLGEQFDASGGGVDGAEGEIGHGGERLGVFESGVHEPLGVGAAGGLEGCVVEVFSVGGKEIDVRPVVAVDDVAGHEESAEPFCVGADVVFKADQGAFALAPGPLCPRGARLVVAESGHGGEGNERGWRSISDLGLFGCPLFGCRRDKGLPAIAFAFAERAQL